MSLDSARLIHQTGGVLEPGTIYDQRIGSICAAAFEPLLGVWKLARISFPVAELGVGTK
jgi:hypothetical protein